MNDSATSHGVKGWLLAAGAHTEGHLEGPLSALRSVLESWAAAAPALRNQLQLRFAAPDAALTHFVATRDAHRIPGRPVAAPPAPPRAALQQPAGLVANLRAVPGFQLAHDPSTPADVIAAVDANLDVIARCVGLGVNQLAQIVAQARSDPGPEALDRALAAVAAASKETGPWRIYAEARLRNRGRPAKPGDGLPRPGNGPAKPVPVLPVRRDTSQRLDLQQAREVRGLVTSSGRGGLSPVGTVTGTRPTATVVSTRPVVRVGRDGDLLAECGLAEAQGPLARAGITLPDLLKLSPQAVAEVVRAASDGSGKDGSPSADAVAIWQNTLTQDERNALEVAAEMGQCVLVTFRLILSGHDVDGSAPPSQWPTTAPAHWRLVTRTAHQAAPPAPPLRIDPAALKEAWALHAGVRLSKPPVPALTAARRIIDGHGAFEAAVLSDDGRLILASGAGVPADGSVDVLVRRSTIQDIAGESARGDLLLSLEVQSDGDAWTHVCEAVTADTDLMGVIDLGDVRVILPRYDVLAGAIADAADPAPVDLWPENLFPLFGLLSSAAQVPERTLAKEQVFVEKQGAQLSATSVDGTATEWAAAQQAVLSKSRSCGRGPRLNSTNDLPDHFNVWAFFGIVDSNGVWITNVDPPIDYEIHPGEGHLNLAVAGGDIHEDVIRSAYRPFTNLFVTTFASLPERTLADTFAAIVNLRGKLNSVLPYVLSIHVLDTVSGGTCPDETYDIYDSAFTDQMHVGQTYETGRVAGWLEQMATTANIPYLRSRLLEMLDDLIGGHIKLQAEDAHAAQIHYDMATTKLDGLIANDLPKLGGDIAWGAWKQQAFKFTRVFTLPDALRQGLTDDDLLGEVALVAIAAMFGADVSGVVDAWTASSPQTVLDGSIAGPLEDTLHYLREFVIPACRGEAHLRAADYGSAAECDAALTSFTTASAYLPATPPVGQAHRFLWLRFARAHLRKGELLHLQGDTAGARTEFKAVFQDSYANGRACVSDKRTVDGQSRPNPLVASVRLDAARGLNALDNGINALGYPQNYLPSLRYTYLIDRAKEAADGLSKAEDQYVRYRCAAEDAAARAASLAGMRDEAHLETCVAQDATARAQADAQAAEQGTIAAEHRVADAQDAMADYAVLTEGQRSEKLLNTWIDLLSTVASAASENAGGTTSGLAGFGKDVGSLLFDDSAYTAGELQRKDNEAQDSLAQAQLNADAADASVQVALGNEALAEMKESVAQRLVDLESQREIGQATWSRMADEMADIVKLRLHDTLTVVYLTQRAVFLATGKDFPIVAVDDVRTNGQSHTCVDVLAKLNGNDRSYLLGETIKAALAELQTAIDRFWDDPNYAGSINQGTQSEQVVLDDRGSTYFSVDPLQWWQFKRAAAPDAAPLQFEISLPQLDTRGAGRFQRSLEAVKVVGKVDTYGETSIVGYLTNSPWSIERIYDPSGETSAHEIPDWIPAAQPLGYRTIARAQTQATQPFSGSIDAGQFEVAVQPDTQVLRQFEYNSPAQHWTLVIDPTENQNVDFSTFTELEVELHYSTRFSAALRSVVVPAVDALPGNRTLAYTIGTDVFVPTGPDQIATVPIRPEDIPNARLKPPLLADLALALIPQPDVTLPPVTVHLTCDGYLDAANRPIDVVATTSAMITDSACAVQVADGRSQDLTSQHPFAVFGDRNRTDAVATPWLSLVVNTPGGWTGRTFTIRINAAENPSLQFTDLYGAALYLQYRH